MSDILLSQWHNHSCFAFLFCIIKFICSQIEKEKKELTWYLHLFLLASFVQALSFFSYSSLFNWYDKLNILDKISFRFRSQLCKVQATYTLSVLYLLFSFSSFVETTTMEGKHETCTSCTGFLKDIQIMLCVYEMLLFSLFFILFFIS